MISITSSVCWNLPQYINTVFTFLRYYIPGCTYLVSTFKAVCPLYTVFAAPHSLLQPGIQPRVCQRQREQGSAEKLTFKVKINWINCLVPYIWASVHLCVCVCVSQISEMSVTTLRDSASISALNTITPSSTCPSLVEGCYGNAELRSVLRCSFVVIAMY